MKTNNKFSHTESYIRKWQNDELKVIEIQENPKKTEELGRKGRERVTPWRHSLDTGRYYYNVTLNINAFTTLCIVITRPLHRSPMALTLSAPLPTGIESPMILSSLSTRRNSQQTIFRTLYAVLNIPFLNSPSTSLLFLSQGTSVCRALRSTRKN